MTDRRRYCPIEVVRVNAETYHLMIGSTMWSEVEWSPSRNRWCIQDAAGHCLTHTESIVGVDKDVKTAIRVAKRMIVDGSMPAPEEAHKARRLREAQGEAKEAKGEPFTIEAREAVPVLKGD